MLSDWESKLARAIEEIDTSRRNRAGVLLSAIPPRAEWEEFVTAVRAGWASWKVDLQQFPGCLLLFYCGLAYYEYEDRNFWSPFARTIGVDSLPTNQQSDTNKAFAEVVGYFGLQLKLRGNGTDFVGSAVHFAGIPLSLWDGFLEICDWALWRKDWRALAAGEWAEMVGKRSGGRRRLKKFLTDNRESASSLIQEMLEAREILSGDASLTISDIAQASILRMEFFEEVPETADFLRPQNPESLFKDHARLVWDQQRNQICLQLPAVKQEKLPAEWRIESRFEKAAQMPDTLVLDSHAFKDRLLLTLESENQREVQTIRGAQPWGIFDMENGGRFTDPNRDELPLRPYVLLSSNRIHILSQDGFDDEENPPNEQIELGDGTACFITRLWPTGKYAELRLRVQGQHDKKIHFRTRSKVQSIFFIGFGRKAAYFSRMAGGKVRTDHLPLLCVAIPDGYFHDVDKELARSFRVLVDGSRADGNWKRINNESTDDSEFYRWNWSKKPLLEIKSGVNKVTSFSKLGEVYKPADLSGPHRFTVEAASHIRVSFDVEIVDRSSEQLDNCWKNLPGACLPLFLLCQSSDGMKWEDLLLAKDVIAAPVPLSPYIFHKYAEHGILVLRGRRWCIKESRAEITSTQNDCFVLKFCGDPSILWQFYRRIESRTRGDELPIIEAKNVRGEIPYLEMKWPQRFKGDLITHLQYRKVEFGAILWSH